MKRELRNVMGGVAVVMLLPFGSALAAPITGLYNTGVNDANVLLADNAVDTHYAISPSWTAIAGDNPPPAFPGAWILNSASPASRWIAPATQPGPSATDTLSVLNLSFDLTGFNPATASFNGRWAADNGGTMFLNGSPVSATPFPVGFNNWTSFSAVSGFVAGLNTLSFHVTNQAFASTNPTGLRVEFLTSDVAPIPEPEVLLMVGLGLGVLGWVGRRRRAQAAA